MPVAWLEIECSGIPTIWYGSLQIHRRVDVLDIHHRFFQVHRGPKYVTTLKMYSDRTTNTECVSDYIP
jgi:hypothetical protein